jgi:hypothetical protein
MTRQFSPKSGDSGQHNMHSLRPVVTSVGCLGHVLRSCKGYRAFDRMDRELGVFTSAGEAACAILAST